MTLLGKSVSQTLADKTSVDVSQEAKWLGSLCTTYSTGWPGRMFLISNRMRLFTSVAAPVVT